MGGGLSGRKTDWHFPHTWRGRAKNSKDDGYPKNTSGGNVSKEDPGVYYVLLSPRPLSSIKAVRFPTQDHSRPFASNQDWERVQTLSMADDTTLLPPEFRAHLQQVYP